MHLQLLTMYKQTILAMDYYAVESAVLYKGGLPIAVQRCFLRRRKNGIVHSV